jgi:hypothetical protein
MNGGSALAYPPFLVQNGDQQGMTY